MEYLVRPLDRLIKVRNTYQITQRQLAKRIGCTSQLISMIETGKAELSYPKAKIIEVEFGVSAIWLLHGEGEMMVEKKKKDASQFSPAFNYFPEIIKTLNTFAERLDLEDWYALNRLCTKINHVDDASEKIS